MVRPAEVLCAPIVVVAGDFYGNVADLAATSAASVSLVECSTVYTGEDYTDTEGVEVYLYDEGYDGPRVDDKNTTVDEYFLAQGDDVTFPPCTLSGNVFYLGSQTYPDIEFGHAFPPSGGVAGNWVPINSNLTDST